MLLRRILSSSLKMSEHPSTYPRVGFSSETALETKSALEKIFLSAVASVLPQKLIRKTMKNECGYLMIGRNQYMLKENVRLVGFGKAVLGMASEVERILHGHLKSGVLCLPKNTKEQFKDRPEFLLRGKSVIKVYEGASNNLPDEDAVSGADAVIEEIKSLCPSDLLIVLISGGGSALLPKPKDGLSLQDKLTTIKLLASCGATINELNTVRKKLSLVKGGGLAVLSYPVKTVGLILSDVVNDPLDVIASGPTVPNLDEPNAAYNVLKKYNLLCHIPNNVIEAMNKKLNCKCIPSTGQGYTHVENVLIGNNVIAIQEAKNSAENLGFRTIVLSNVIDSPVHTICDFYLNLSYEICKALHSNELNSFVSNVKSMLMKCHYEFPSSLIEDLMGCMKIQEFCKGICIIAGGETTVQVKGSGIGGRNQELALMFSQKLHSFKQSHSLYYKNFDVTFLSAGTDGIDGNSCAAGAVGCSDLIGRAIYNYIDPGHYLMNNDSYNFFKIADGGTHLITTGHTGTNVMDLHLLLIRNVSSLGEC